jgi:hypothetical protein
MNVLVSWVRDNQPVTAMLDFIELAKSHSGRNMAEALVSTLERYGIAHKVSCSSIRAVKHLLGA